MKPVYLTFFFAVSIVLVGCDSTLRHARQVAAVSGNPEMRQVIDHYRDDTAKLSAAVFLIENIPGHQTQTYDLIDKQGQISEVSLYRPEITSANYRRFLDSLGLRVRPRTVADAAAVTAEYLIRNIDQAFDSWQHNPWSQNYSEKIFREFILPYRIADEELSDWRTFFIKRYTPMLDTLSQPKTIANVAALVIADIREWYRYDDGVLQLKPMPTPEEAYRHRKSECYSMANMFVLGLRAMGIAAVSDVIPVWGTSRGGHAEAVYFDEYDNPVMLMTGNNLGAQPVKVYREHFSFQHENTSFREDVTDRYVLTSDIRVPVDTALFDADEWPEIGLATYGSRDWRPAVKADRITTIRNETTGRTETVCEFRRIGRSILYLPMVLRNHRVQPVGEPFMLDYKGNITYIRPDTAHRMTLYLTTLINDLAAFTPDVYELLYWDGEGWHKHPNRIVTDPESASQPAYIVRDVPTGTFFRLHDPTSGRDYRNRPFVSLGWWVQRY